MFGKDFLPNLKAEDSQSFKFIWPIATEKISERVTSVFGESRWDHFHNGLDIASFYEPVIAIGDGKLLYSRYSADDPFREEWGSGDTVWIDHGEGAYSAYYHLNPGRKKFIDLNIKKGQEIGTTGNTGHSSGGHLHFVLTLDYGQKIINPLIFLPKIEDETPPSIGGLSIHVGERYTNINSGDTINLSKEFPFTVQIMDSGVRSSQRFGVESVQFKLNGKLIKDSKFKFIRFENGVWVNDASLTFTDLFMKDRYFIGNLALPSGEHTIEVTAIDFHGNAAVKTFLFYVTRI
ncbi:M23 family metallopeptidase [Leptospira sp. GIMC2001]|uniref:M23 family metallopeptidase n=1 Tax=Leptospira sp. GIMC2001 TaxID=1513297 RepID=UPI00234A9C68|nr:M23 family metallopeptidase [Leptospira sp. GIMC2001]WCL51374.1 M23 family metallopeptidase [Leptospira sp. GIMC2001]